MFRKFLETSFVISSEKNKKSIISIFYRKKIRLQFSKSGEFWLKKYSANVLKLRSQVLYDQIIHDILPKNFKTIFKWTKIQLQLSKSVGSFCAYLFDQRAGSPRQGRASSDRLVDSSQPLTSQRGCPSQASPPHSPLSHTLPAPSTGFPAPAGTPPTWSTLFYASKLFFFIYFSELTRVIFTWVRSKLSEFLNSKYKS